MDFLEIVAFLGACFVGLVAVAAIFLPMWLGAPVVPVLLDAMLRRQGDEVARTAIASGSREFALALKQCVHCRSAARCQAWLDSGNREGFDAFCPNAGYVSRVRSLAAFRGKPTWT